MLDVQAMTTEELRQFVREDYENRRDESDTDLLFEVLEEPVRRSEPDPRLHTTEQAWQIFLKHYAPPAYRECDL